MNNVGDDKKATNEFGKLVRLGLVRPTGENKKRRYFINKDVVNL